MINGKGRCKGEGLRIERDGKGRREGDGRIEIGKGRKGRKGGSRRLRGKIWGE